MNGKNERQNWVLRHQKKKESELQALANQQTKIN